MKTIAIIGGTGMLGRPVAKQLQQDGFDVRILSRQPSKARQQLGDGFDYRPAELANVASLKSALVGVDAVHINVRGHDKASHYTQHIEGTKNILAALEGAKLDVISMISSASAHPEFNDRWDNRYKWEAEQLLKQSEHPYLAFLPSWFMESLPMFVQKNRLMQIGPSSQPIHWVAADDYAKEVSRAYQNTDCRNQRLSVYGPESLTMSEAFNRYAQHHRLKHSHIPAWLAKTIGRVTRDPEMVDIADLTVHYNRTGEKKVPGVIRTSTTFQQWLAVQIKEGEAA